MTESRQPPRENVVPLKQPERRPSGVILARLPASMHALRDKTRQHLQGLLREFFDKADDSLFKLADQAASNQEQNLYFDSMREVRLRRRSMEADFFHRLDQAFAALLESGRASEAPSMDEFSLDELSLVQNDELEELVAAENMVNKANEQFAEPTQHLTLRMDQLVPVKVYLKNNPLGANVICGSFSEAAKAVKVDVKAKLVLFKLFDKLVAARLGPLYQTLNQQLIDANILPSLKAGSVPGKRSGAPRSPGSAQTEQLSREEEASQVLHTLRDLLGSQGRGATQGAMPSSGGASGELDSQDLIQLLSRAQQGAGPQSGGLMNLQQLMQELSGSRRNVNQVDEDVINLVGMMFEFILDDRNLAAPMKALLGRLQIPLVKVAVVDKSFFGKGGHPARRLLNEMAMAALGWQDTGEESRHKDGFYQKVDMIVQTLLSDFESDVGIFDRMLLEFRSYQEKERRRARVLEQRTLDAEDGKARSERARAEVDSALAALTQGRSLEPAANQLLHEAWSKVLFITCLKKGVDSAEWHDALMTGEQLVWSVTVAMDRDNRQKLLKTVPELLSKLRAGLESIAFNPYEMTQLFKQLERLHLARLRGQASPARAPAPAEQPELQRQPAKATQGVQMTAQPEQRQVEPLQQEPPPSAQFAAKAEAAPDVPSEPDVRSEEVPPAEKAPGQKLQGEPISRDTEAFLSESDPHLALVGNLTQGSWFEIQDGQGQTYRCRLAAMIKPTGKYIFVNRSGMKVAEETREGLARALKSGRLRILDDGMLFDRALEAVIGNLRNARAR